MDIISNNGINPLTLASRKQRVVILISKTLAERVARDFSRIKLKKIFVKVPKLKVKQKANKKHIQRQFKVNKLNNSYILNLLIKNAIEKIKREKKGKKIVNEDKSYKILKEDNHIHGYDTVSKTYGSVPQASYIDYSKLFSYLGKFRAQTPYQNMAEHIAEANKSFDHGFSLVATETMEKGARHVRYFMPSASDIHAASSSLVPVAGMSSSEWEQFKLWMKLDPVMYRLKTSII